MSLSFPVLPLAPASDPKKVHAHHGEDQPAGKAEPPLPSGSGLAPYQGVAEPVREPADRDQDQAHPQAEGQYEQQAESEAPHGLGEDDQPDRVPAGNDAP